MATRHRPLLRACRLTAAPVADVLGLIDAERLAWRKRLLWDPAELGDALDLAASARLLPGVAVLAEGRAVAYLSVHSSPGGLRACSAGLHPDAPPETAALLARAVLDLPEARGQRFEAQLTVFEWQEALDAGFAAQGVKVARRQWLRAELPDEPIAPGDSNPSVRPWCSERVEACAGVLAAAHSGSVEARINSAFGSHEAATAYLSDVARGPGCGHFLPWASSLAMDRGRVVGFCLVTTVSPGVAHVPQIAVHPFWQGRGLGDALLERVRRAARAEGCDRMTLSVSVENERARNWYLSRGFRPLEPLSAYWT